MRLERFTVNNYRSITEAEKLDLSEYTVLIGPNNEGKSNILRALVMGMSILERAGVRGWTLGNQSRLLLNHTYSWEDDYPKSLQKRKAQGRTTLRYDFRLDDDEILSFWDEVGSRINGELPIEIQLGKEQSYFRIPKKGPGGEALTAKRNAIAGFIGRRLSVAYVQAQRSAADSQREVDRLVRRALDDLQSRADYREALELIESLQEPILSKLAASLEETLSLFLPDVKRVSIRLDEEDRRRPIRSKIIIDDGDETPLAAKGDGIQSLSTVALVKDVAERLRLSNDIVLAIEEPEAHLHPGAIHQLRAVVEDIATTQQVIVSTHSPLFVNRNTLGSNVLVRDNRARTAESVQEIREILGVRTSDNLHSAAVAVIVEGASDQRILQAIIPTLSQSCARALGSGEMGIQALHGGTNLSYRLGELESGLCIPHAFLDDDQSGRTAVTRALDLGLIRDRDYNLASRQGYRDSEIEDLLSVDVYADHVRREFGVNLRDRSFTSARSKWSERVERSFSRAGKLFDDAAMQRIKTLVATSVEQNPEGALLEPSLGVLQGLVDALEVKLGGVTST
ncbi:ATP-dependent endonuclease [Egicoccus sp. AB-alg2]|uniref:ATP-dependent nuclease n=1 Tax=Egicoccus sp. AB-alg2 TaxID=3242693 RepID=UPI00359E0FE1